MTCILVTGATGVIGSELVPLLLAEPQCQVRLILRADSEEHLRKRMAGLAGYWGLPLEDAAVANRLHAFTGDVSRPRLGLDEGTWRRLTAEVTHIIHAAGNVRLNQSLEAARRDAVDSARHVAELAWACRRGGGPAKLDAVSTVGVAGRIQGLIPEQPITQPREFRNTYEQAKAEAEEFLLGELDRGLPLTIHRPSMVIGHSETGNSYRPQVFHYLCEFLSGRTTWGIIPDPRDHALDLIPVDHVAQAIHLTMTCPDSIGRVFHLCAGPHEATVLRELAYTLQARLREQGTSIPRLRFIPLTWFRIVAAIAGTITCGRVRRRLRSLPHLLRYLKDRQSFDNSATRRFLKAKGLEFPRQLDWLASAVHSGLR